MLSCCHSFCTQCIQSLITEGTEGTRTHSSFTLEEVHTMSRDKLSKLIPSFIHTCQDHSDQQLKYYCQQCIIPVCIECTIINHKDHPVTEVSKQVDSNKATVHESIQGFQVAQQQLKKVLISGEEIKEKINARKNEIDTIIRQRFSTLQQLLHEREEALLAQSKEVANAKEACLSLQLDKVQHLLETMSYCENLVTSAVVEYNDVELLSVAHTLQTRANQLQQEFSKTFLEVCESPTISVDINTDELATKIANVDITFNEISPNNTTAVVPLSVYMEKELNVKVVSRDSKRKKLSKGGAIVSGRLVPIEEKGTPIEAKSTDCGDGTYLVSLIPQTFGEQKLSLTIKGQSIQGSPFNISVVIRDYTILKNPVQTITGTNTPAFIAFSNNGDMFVTSYSSNCIYVYESSGRQKSIIGSHGTGPLQFNAPLGIAINGEFGDIIYVAENGGNRIHRFSLGGKFLGTFGSKGFDKGQFLNPWGICFGPYGRIYVADTINHRIQVFNSDHTFSHIINCNKKYPYGLSFDFSGHLHVTYDSNVVSVLTPEGQYIRQYGHSHLNRPRGIAIDSAGNSLVVNKSGESLSIFNPHGNFIHSIRGFNQPIGVAVASNGSVWVADASNNRLVKY